MAKAVVHRSGGKPLLWLHSNLVMEQSSLSSFISARRGTQPLAFWGLPVFSDDLQFIFKRGEA